MVAELETEDGRWQRRGRTDTGRAHAPVMCTSPLPVAKETKPVKRVKVNEPLHVQRLSKEKVPKRCIQSKENDAPRADLTKSMSRAERR